ncbi:MAG TPA: acyl carrier protein [Holosporales bacterium]|nr:acyl carrier protein [Holosporales bacterium]HCU06378.1 acyl carrier protein [Holosporales bacterium]
MNNLENQLKEDIINTLNLEDITPDDIAPSEPLFGEGLGLDSIDALEIGIMLKKKYNLTIAEQDDTVKKHFYSIETLAKFIQSQEQA